MSRSHFVAARSSRHRIAALALYRALIRSASRVHIPLPLQVPGPRSSLVKLVRKRFVKNTPLTSFRLIYASMAAGYKLLALLTNAQTIHSPEHAHIINRLQNHQHISQASRAAAQSSRPPHSRPRDHHNHHRNHRAAPSARPPAEPLLINVAPPGAPPAYTSNILPRPASTLPHPPPRRVPTVSATADGQPFLRITKPQPRALSRMIGRKGRLFSNRIVSIMDVDEHLVPEAALEDEWDTLMRDLRREEGIPAHGSDQDEAGPRHRQQGINHAQGIKEQEAEDADADAHERTFGWSAQLSRLWYEYKIETTWEDWIARGNALQKLVQAEKALLEQEETPNRETSRPRQTSKRTHRHNADGNLAPPNVGTSSATQLPVVAALREYRASHPTMSQEDKTNPFASDTWAAIVRSQTKRMLVWLKRGSSGLNAHDMPWKTARKEAKASKTPVE